VGGGEIMKRLGRATLYGSVIAAAIFVTAGPSLAIEPGDFQATLAGITTGIPLAVAPPPGLYGSLITFIGPNGVGTGQNSAANGFNGHTGSTVFGAAIYPALVWVPGWNVFGGNTVFAVSQPFYTIAGFQTNCTPTAVGCVGSPPATINSPINPVNTQFWENVHNTVFYSDVSWNWKNGWFTSLGFRFQGPDGSTYDGTTNQDYWTLSPTVAIAYIDRNWKLAVNFDYDFHTASAGHTGLYAGIAHNVFNPPVPAPNGCVGFACPGIGYQSGNQFYIDWSWEYRWGKLAFGPAGDFKWQTTADSPGSGFSCTALANSPVYGPTGTGLTCGRATNISLGGIIGYDFGPAELEVYALDTVYNKDDYRGWTIFTRLSFKLDNPAPAPPTPPKPVIGKAQ
jgi:hypothetical protein